MTGSLIAVSLTGCWREESPQCKLDSGQLKQIEKLLLLSGVGALVWRCVNRSELKETLEASELRRAYYYNALFGRVLELQIARAVECLRTAGVEPLLVKGRAIGRYYPEPGLRPYTDIDLCIACDQYETAQNALERFELTDTAMDLSYGIGRVMSKKYDLQANRRETEAVFARSETIEIGDCQVRVPSATDHLRIACLHFLKHSCQRPLWLCDVAALIESPLATLDWEEVLGANRKTAWAIACVLKLAHELLGANEVSDLPKEYRRRKLPRWLKPAVLKQWKQPAALRGDQRRFSDHLFHPTKWRGALRARWSDPIWVTYNYNLPFNDFPRLAFQIGDGLLKTARFIGSYRKRE